MLHWYHRTKGSGLESHLLLPKHQDESGNHEPVPSLVQGPASQGPREVVPLSGGKGIKTA